MRLLVTGGAGFIGSAFCRRLRKDYSQFVLVNLDCLYPCSTSTLSESAGSYTFVKGNLRDGALLTALLKEHAIDTVVHFAAQSHVDTSFTDPLSYTQDNVVGTHTLLEACRTYGAIKRFVHISTDEVYGENTGAVFTETSLLKPTNPYAATKASAEMLVHSYIHSYGLPAVVIRSNNVYGPGQYPEKVIPKFIFQLLDGKSLTIQGSGHQLRSFLYVEDAVDAVLCVLFQGAQGEVYNISSTDELSIRELARTLVAVLRPAATLEESLTFIEDRHFNDKRYWIESKPLAALGWRQKVPFAEGLAATIAWYKAVDRLTYWCDNETSPAKAVERIALVWGSRGWIGSQFVPLLSARGFAVVNATSRADDRAAVEAEVAAVKPTHLVSLIGRTHGEGFSTIDYLEQSGKLLENLTDNLYGPVTLAAVAKASGLHLLYMGTGCIFTDDGTGHAFKESDQPNFFGSAYSTVKGITDRIMNEEYKDTCLNVRIRMPISAIPGPRNFISKIISYKNICSIPNSMTVMEDVLPCLVECMERKVVGPLNATNPGVIEHNTILGWYKELQDPGHVWTNVDTKELLASCVKSARSNNRLDTTRIQSLFPSLPTIGESVRRLLETHSFRV
jgi:UDP-glucose 4,6-dehydratase